MDIYYPVDLETANAPSVLVADAQHVGRERVMGICSPVDNLWNDAPGEIARGYLMRYENKTLQELPPLKSLNDIHIVRQAEHGRLILAEDSREGYIVLTYIPDEGYLGKEQFEAVVFMGNDSVRIVYHLVVQSKATDQLSDSEFDKLCPKVEWIISELSPEDYNNPSSWYRATSLQALLAGAQQALSGFADFSGAALAQTMGARITLDTDAAGHGWFIDYTPYLNEEWLPTSNPYEWKAKPGSEAEGKMDLLSVLLHEYGHVLGIEHSADSHDAMSAVLQPGMRRLPSASPDRSASFSRRERVGDEGTRCIIGNPACKL
jgi:hypothetical protein